MKKKKYVSLEWYLVYEIWIKSTPLNSETASKIVGKYRRRRRKKKDGKEKYENHGHGSNECYT